MRATAFHYAYAIGTRKHSREGITGCVERLKGTRVRQTQPIDSGATQPQSALTPIRVEKDDNAAEGVKVSDM